MSQLSRTALDKLHYYHITFIITFVSCQKFPFVLAGPIVFIMTGLQRQMIKLYNVIHVKLDFVLIPFQILINQLIHRAFMRRRDSQCCFIHFSPFKGHDNSEEDGGAEKYVLNFEQICCSFFMKWLKRDLENRGQICFCC